MQTSISEPEAASNQPSEDKKAEAFARITNQCTQMHPDESEKDHREQCIIRFQDIWNINNNCETRYSHYIGGRLCVWKIEAFSKIKTFCHEKFSDPDTRLRCREDHEDEWLRGPRGYGAHMDS